MQRIWNYNPKIKLLILLRNPVERAFAHWNMQRYKGIEPLDFFDAIREEETRIAGAPPAQARRLRISSEDFMDANSSASSNFFHESK